jgi:uncharacterized protein YecA (UPF0149 family)
MLELVFNGTGLLQEVKWEWIDKVAIPAHLLPQLQTEAEKLRQKRVANAKAERGKIGRNEPCPCGSNKKYKKCCLPK